MSYFENRPVITDFIMGTSLTVKVNQSEDGMRLILTMTDHSKPGAAKSQEVDISVKDWRAFVRSVNKLVKSL